MEPPRVILAIETSQREGSVALRHNGGRVRVERLRSITRHDDLLPAIDRILKQSHMAPTSLEAVAISIGPGGFTGLRIAIATAKMLAETLGVALAAVPSALVAAASTPGIAAPALVALASKGDRAWCTVVDGDERLGWRILGTPGLRAAEEIDWQPIRSVLLDPFAPPRFGSIALAAGIPILEPHWSATACLELAERQLSDRAAVDPVVLLPLYARPPEAVISWQARRATGTSGSTG
jgi:tRNA threonylcarbamoyladenosine biosynthesis protein TsaB